MITAEAVYPVLERRVAAARSRAALSFRVFDTRTRLRDDDARTLALANGGGDDRAALLTAVALAGFAEPTPWEEPGELSLSGDFGAAHVALTRSAPRPGFFAFAPETMDDGTERAALSLIREAKRFLHMETQFLRSATIAKALAQAARVNPDLELVLILPFAPERYAFEGRRDSAMRHGEALQLSALRRVGRAFGERFVLLSPAKPTRKNDVDAVVAYGAGAVYVHSKILIADGEAAMIGSANMNGRSLRWDTEASLVWRSAEGVGAFMADLAQSWMGDGRGEPGLASTWREAAKANAASPPDARAGFLLPHDLRRVKRFARGAVWLPDDLF